MEACLHFRCRVEKRVKRGGLSTNIENDSIRGLYGWEKDSITLYSAALLDGRILLKPFDIVNTRLL
jgi:hypothetical protein